MGGERGGEREREGGEREREREREREKEMTEMKRRLKSILHAAGEQIKYSKFP